MGNQVTKSGSSFVHHHKNDNKNKTSNNSNNDNQKSTFNADTMYPQLLIYKGIIISIIHYTVFSTPSSL